MRRKRYIAWFLLVVSMVMLTAAVLPHHHHRHILCLQHDVAACGCDCGESHASDTYASEGHHACNGHCVTNFQSLSPDEAEGDVSPDYSTCQLLYTLADVLSLPIFQDDTQSKSISYYLEKLHATCLPHGLGLRAPPVA